MDDLIQTDVLIIGAGIAGGTAALLLAEAGVQVTLVTRAREPSDSNTYYAQGGIIYRGETDSPALLAQDIEHAGAGHCNPYAVAILSSEGPPLVKKILIDKQMKSLAFGSWNSHFKFVPQEKFLGLFFSLWMLLCHTFSS